MTRLFNDIKLIKKEHLLNQFLACEDHTDAIKLASVLFVESFLRAKETHTGVNTDYLCLVDDFELFNKYPWGSVAFKLMKDGLLAALDQRKPKYNIYGCVVAFQIWAFEHIPLLSTLCCRSINNDGSPLPIFPRILKWNNIKYRGYKFLAKHVFNKKRLKLKKELVLTDLEKEEQVVKDVLVRVPSTSMTTAQEEDEVEEEDEEDEEEDEEEVGDEEDEVGFEEGSPSTGHNKKSRTKHALDFASMFERLQHIDQQIGELKGELKEQVGQLSIRVDNLSSQFLQFKTELREMKDDRHIQKESCMKEVNQQEDLDMYDGSEMMVDSDPMQNITTQGSQQPKMLQRLSVKSRFLCSPFLVTKKRKRAVPSICIIKPMRRISKEEGKRLAQYLNKEGDKTSPILVYNIAMTPELLYDLATPTRLVTSEADIVHFRKRMAFELMTGAALL
ncbi:hypothetical protein HHK36_020309 [Tetracentron sinense]|uniref:DUF1985 domain-containing protein n=1 Tax=Tetracentron sinense TaxID=13715 RepID=A0A834YRD6_TETSI|nr:hypothetical protein HHK36_020309 [Tetracentron sinense]